MNIKVSNEYSGYRLDTFIAEECEISRSQVKKTISKGVKLNNIIVAKSSHKVVEGDVIEFEIENLEINVVESSHDIELDIKYEDEDILIVNKQQGLVVHQSESNREPITLVNALLKKNIPLSSIDEIRRGIVHRLDKDTSGLMVIAKTNEAHLKLVEQFKNREVEREYIGICKGLFKENEGIINQPIGRDKKNRTRMAIVKDGKDAITKFKVLEEFEKLSVVKFILVTGRTHQIRVHMQYLNHPILGDDKYGGLLKGYPIGQFLHCRALTLKHPINSSILHFEAEPNKIFTNTLLRLRADKKIKEMSKPIF